jgi:hypothetical protein
MHLTPHDDFRPADTAGGASTGDPHATEAWPRPVRRRAAGGPDSQATRLSLAALADVAAPTREVDARALLESAPSAPAWRPRVPRTGGVFGWTPTAAPSLREAAQARVHVAEREERRKLRHERHMDFLEMVRAYLGVIALVLLVLFVGAAAMLAIGIMSGWYTWMPVQHS